MNVPKIQSHHVAELAPLYFADSWEALEHLPIAHTPGPFYISTFRPRPADAVDTDEAFQAALADAIRRGRPRWLEIVRSEGGVVTAQQMATLLGISRQAVDKRRRLGTLLAFQDTGRAYLYPAWQVRDGSPLPGLERVLAILREGEHDPTSQFIFFLSPDVVPDDARPLDLLREGHQEAIIRAEVAARGYLVQGAA